MSSTFDDIDDDIQYFDGQTNFDSESTTLQQNETIVKKPDKRLVDNYGFPPIL